MQSSLVLFLWIVSSIVRMIPPGVLFVGVCFLSQRETEEGGSDVFVTCREEGGRRDCLAWHGRGALCIRERNKVRVDRLWVG